MCSVRTWRYLFQWNHRALHVFAGHSVGQRRRMWLSSRRWAYIVSCNCSRERARNVLRARPRVGARFHAARHRRDRTKERRVMTKTRGNETRKKQWVNAETSRCCHVWGGVILAPPPITKSQRLFTGSLKFGKCIEFFIIRPRRIYY